MKKLLVAGCLAVITLSGCQTTTTKRVEVDDALLAIEKRKQKEFAFNNVLENYNRLERISYPILTNAIEICGEEIGAESGFIAINAHTLGEEYKDTANHLGYGDELKVVSVIEASPANKAGLLPGDSLIRFGDIAVPTGEDALKEFSEKYKEAIKPDKEYVLEISRKDGSHKLLLTTEKTCNFHINVSQSDAVNAYADGKNIIITTGMMRFASNDYELALVVGHELAHNAMKHIEKKTTNAMGGAVLDILAAVYGIDTGGGFSKAAGQAYSQDFEAEADYVGMYILARSGMDAATIEKTPFFWRRMATNSPGGISNSHSASHPATPERFLALDKTIQEIALKVREGRPLMPEMKEDVVSENKTIVEE